MENATPFIAWALHNIPVHMYSYANSPNTIGNYIDCATNTGTLCTWNQACMQGGGGWRFVFLVPPPPPLESDIFFSFFFACQRGWWCTMGTPTPSLENWLKHFEEGKKMLGVNFFMSGTALIMACMINQKILHMPLHEMLVYMNLALHITPCLCTWIGGGGGYFCI